MELANNTMKILITGGAGFIGSNLTEHLLNDERVSLVRVFDNLATGSLDNLSEFASNQKFEFVEGDIRNYHSCLQVSKDVDLISHQAALGSVPRSINDPLTTNDVNITGTLNIFTAAKENKVKRVVYAASSSTYGDHPDLPKVEDKIGNPLSPYAVTKLVNELYAKVYANVYGMELIGLRYFNVFGPKQNPKGAYAAVIPLFAEAILNNQSPIINGDGTIFRDFTFVANAVQANVLALFTENNNALNQVYNIAYGEKTSLLQLVEMINKIVGKNIQPAHRENRKGDIPKSLADISKAKKLLNYHPQFSVEQGLQKTMEWYKTHLKK